VVRFNNRFFTLSVYLSEQTQPDIPGNTEAKNTMPSSTLTETFLPFSAVQAATGLSRSTIYEKIGQGTFPAPIKIGRASRWSTLELRAWMESLRMQQIRRPHAVASR
jgi:prophage regulatory protein